MSDDHDTSWSALRELIPPGSPLRYRHMRQTPRPDSDTFALGRAIHTAVLQPARLPLDYVCWLGGQRRGKAWEAFKEDAGERTILTPDQLEAAIGCGVAVRGNADAMALLTGGEVEVERVWVDEPTGLRIKGRADCIFGEGLTELKTSRNAADPRMFSRDVAKYHYHGQLALYRDGFGRGWGAGWGPCNIIAVEPAKPHDVAVYSIMSTAVDEGWRLCRRLLDQLAECLESDEWPGAVTIPTWLDIPEWAYGEAEEVNWMKEAG